MSKISVFKQYYLCKQELIYSARNTETQLLRGIFLCPITASLSKCPPFCGMVILVTFMRALKTVSLLSRNFISISDEDI